MALSIPFLPPVSKAGAPLDMPFVFFDDFGEFPSVGTGDNAATWRNSTDNSGTVLLGDVAAGAIVLTPGSSATDYVSIQKVGACIYMDANKDIVYKARIRLDDADDAKWFVGLAAADDAATGSTAAPVLDGNNDTIGFRNTAGNTADIYYVVEDDATETTADTTKDLADATFVDLAFEVRGTSSVTFYVNGEQVGKSSTNLPDASTALTPYFEVSSTGTGSTAMTIDYILVSQDR